MGQIGICELIPIKGNGIVVITGYSCTKYMYLKLIKTWLVLDNYLKNDTKLFLKIKII